MPRTNHALAAALLLLTLAATGARAERTVQLAIKPGDVGTTILRKADGGQSWYIVIGGKTADCYLHGSFVMVSSVFDKLVAGKRAAMVVCDGKKSGKNVETDLGNSAHRFDLAL